MNDSSYCSKFIFAFDAVNILDFLHPNQGVVVSHCFILQFPNNIWLETFFSPYAYLPSIFFLQSDICSGFLPIFKLHCSFSYFWVFRGFFVYFGYKSFIRYVFYKYFLPVSNLSSHSLGCLLHNRNFNVNEVQLINSLFHGLIWNSSKPSDADSVRPANLSRLNDFIIPDVILAE